MEAALIMQMVSTHSATMSIFSKYGGDFGGECSMGAGASALSRMLRAYVTQFETFHRLRKGGTQLVRVEHVHVNAGAQAVIGTVGSA
jgi:hypothetical protein